MTNEYLSASTQRSPPKIMPNVIKDSTESEEIFLLKYETSVRAASLGRKNTK